MRPKKYALWFTEEDLEALERAVTSCTLPPEQFRKKALSQIGYHRNRIEHGRTQDAMALRKASGPQPA